MYKLTIVKQRDNPNFKEQLEEHNRRNNFGRSFDVQTAYPDAMLTERTLEVVLTDDEFAAIKKAVLEAM